ncbi:MAG: SDR family oxidoreductase [Verrucomicrobiota bacterium]|jgi:UDP-N-acetylglucosamine 4-epimerase|nr:SDR family oxidoreductase [Verrucomicrobiota bacterium]
MTIYEKLQRRLRRSPRKWLVTGVAGFIGSHIVEKLLQLNQKVVGLDNFSTGKRANLEDLQGSLNAKQRRAFRFIEGDITSETDCKKACRGVDYVLHQAALGSVPRSFADPLSTHLANTTGFLQILLAAQKAKVKRVVYASSSSVYGDEKTLPKKEEKTGALLSPYAVSKMVDEMYAHVFGIGYGQEIVGLRYFNVFGPRQDPEGPYAAVIPQWMIGLLKGKPTTVNGDGKTTRDFCYVANVIQANLLAATSKAAAGNVYNIANGKRTSLNNLHRQLRTLTGNKTKPEYRPFREGDVKHSLADISEAKQDLDFRPTHAIEEGLEFTVEWYKQK